LENFWQGAGMHTDPGSLLPDLSAAYPESRTLLPSGELAISEWETGFEALSAVLMKAELYNEYVLDAAVAAKSEWVITYPTKSYHVDQGLPVIAPFSNRWFRQESCDNLIFDNWDREQQTLAYNPSCGYTGCPPRPFISTCKSTNVVEFHIPGAPLGDVSSILGSNNSIKMSNPIAHATENGWVRITFSTLNNNEGFIHRMIPVSGTGYHGLPATGFMVQQFTNAGAADGLLAQYGNLFIHKGLVLTTE
jgi:hypothetical protein